MNAGPSDHLRSWLFLGLAVILFGLTFLWEESLLHGVSVLAMLLALVFWLRAKPKPCVLLLRRFHQVQLNEAFGRVIEGGLSRSYRIITLDDSSFRSLGVTREIRRGTRFVAVGCVVGLIVLLLLLVGAAWLILTSETPDFGSALMKVLALLAGIVLFIGLLIALLVVVSSYIFVTAHSWRVLRQSRRSVNSQRDLSTCLKAIARLSNRQQGWAFLAPQATVVSVTDEYWRVAVAKFLYVTKAVVIDVSLPSENLLWEIDAVLRDSDGRCVFVRDSSKPQPPGAAHSTVESESIEARLRKLLHEHTVIRYNSERPEALWKFVGELTEQLDRVAGEPMNQEEIMRREGLALTLRDRLWGWGSAAFYYSLFLGPIALFVFAMPEKVGDIPIASVALGCMWLSYYAGLPVAAIVIAILLLITGKRGRQDTRP